VARSKIVGRRATLFTMGWVMRFIIATCAVFCFGIGVTFAIMAAQPSMSPYFQDAVMFAAMFFGLGTFLWLSWKPPTA